MKQVIHRTAGVIATLCIATFFVSTVLVELFGSYESIAQVKSLIVMPGLFILVPAMALTGATGFALSKSRKGGLVQAKKSRMPIIAGNGIIVLIPCAIFLERWAIAGDFGTAFYVVQALELVAGTVNLTLMTMNIRDGMKLTGRLKRPRQTAQS